MTNATVVHGARTVQRCPTQPDEKRWQGHVVPDYEEDDRWREKIWAGPTIEKVVGDMNKDLGDIPDPHYIIAE